MRIDDLLQQLVGVVQRTKGWMALCPAHDDTTPSLSIDEGDDGRLLLKCHASCTIDEICAAMRITKSELFPARQDRSSPMGKIMKMYDYVDEGGKLQFQVVRLAPKAFRQRKPTENGGWDWSVKDVRVVLYKLPEVRAAAEHSGTVYIVEGEKDADNCLMRGLIATTNAMGAGKWKKEHSDQVAGAGRVVILPDNDVAGIQHAVEIASALRGQVKDLRVVRLPPQLGEHAVKDVSDYFAAGGDRQSLEALVDAAPQWTPTAPPTPAATTSDPEEDLRRLLPDLRVLGQSDGTFFLFDTENRRQVPLRRLADLDYPTLVNVAGPAVLSNVSRRNRPITGDTRPTLADVKDLVALVARKRAVYFFDRVGQGVFRHAAECLLVVNGDQACLWDGKSGRDLDSPIVAHTYIELDGGKRWAPHQLVELAKTVTAEQASRVLESVTDCVARWNWRAPEVTQALAAFIMSASIQAVWNWRPQVWITARSTAGKSTFLGFINELLQPLTLLREAQTTEAGLRQEVRHDGRFILLDEMEKNVNRGPILELFRTSGRGGVVTRGTQDQKPISFGLRHIAFIASIEVGLHRAADRSRYLVVEMEPHTEGRGPLTMGTSQLEDLRNQVHAVALWAALPAAHLAAKLASTTIPGLDGRFIESVAVPVAFISVCRGWNYEEATAALVEMAGAFSDSAPVEHAADDEAMLLEDIAMARVKVAETVSGGTRYVEHAVSDIINNGTADWLRQLAQHGVAVTQRGEIFIKPDMVTTDLLSSTRWADLDLQTILLRVKGAHAGRHYIANKKLRGVLLPLAALVDDEGPTDGLDGPGGDQHAGPEFSQ